MIGSGRNQRRALELNWGLERGRLRINGQLEGRQFGLFRGSRGRNLFGSDARKLRFLRDDIFFSLICSQ